MSELPLLTGAARNLAISLTPEEVARFDDYRRELLEWNERVNLTAVTRPEEVETKHFVDSLTLLGVCRFSTDDRPRLERERTPGAAESQAPPLRIVLPKTARVVDVGTGAGLPGIPLKIAVPTLRLTLVESIQKKTAFLRHVVAQLGLTDVEVASARAEDLAHNPRHRAAYDLALARAVTNLAALVEITLPFCRAGGFLVAYKGRAAKNEVAAARRAMAMVGGELAGIVTLRPLTEMEPRALVVIRKVRPTPGAYPRRAGLPAKSPL